LRLGAVWIGCVFDAVAQGLATSSEPFSPSDGWTQKAKGLFGEPVQVLLCASTHRPSVVELDGILVVNPGSAVLPADGAGPSFALLTIEDEKVEVKIVPLDA
jgi:predicted phosphodiesterase